MKGLCIALAIAALAVCASIFQQNIPIIIHWIDKLGFIAPLIFLLLYCFATLSFLPTMVLTLAGGILFGPILGTLFNLIGATLGASCAFFISRHFAFDWLANKQNKPINKLITGVERWGWQFIALLRIVPIVPFSLVNYGLGLTRIKFSHYFMTTIIFLIPTEIVSTYCGYAGMDMLIHSGELYKRISLFFLVSLGVLLILFRVRQLKRNG
ncbi:TVP38/TMEM64 family protein [Legionella nagasakiensis]|uniref:TVP38/TMEM64 family protein n=1 Tax=Legionella nagasakiensis TaxID=535290 RepID=UPI00105478B2|nr:TVP38/TMEM64 family protein [Legionella nagasakiensis]